jgi:hypothetical protein
MTLFCTLIEIHYRVVDFLVRPVEQSPTPTTTETASPPTTPISLGSFDFPGISPPSSPRLVRQGSCSSSSSSSRRRKDARKLGDFGRTARIEAVKNRMTELYVMP